MIFRVIKMTCFSCLSLLKTATPVHSVRWNMQSSDHNGTVSVKVADTMLSFTELLRSRTACVVASSSQCCKHVFCN